MSEQLINNQMSVAEQWQILEPLVDAHIKTFFSELKKPYVPAPQEISLIKTSAVKLLELRKKIAAKDDERLAASKTLLRVKVELEHGDLMKFFESFNEANGTIFSIREINRSVLPLKCFLNVAGKPLEQMAAAKKKTPISISKLRESPELLAKLDDADFNAEYARYKSFDEFKKAWSGEPKKLSPAARIVASFKQVKNALAEIAPEIRQGLDNATDGFVREFETLYFGRKWAKVPTILRELLKASKKASRPHSVRKKVEDKITPTEPTNNPDLFDQPRIEHIEGT